MSSRYTSSGCGRMSRYDSASSSNYGSTVGSTCGGIYNSPSSESSLGLPDDEFRILQKRQNRDRLEAHFLHKGTSRYAPPRGPRASHRNENLTQDERLRISEVRNATRRALGPSFDFTDDWYDRTKRVESVRRVDTKYEQPIPPKYLDEYHAWSRKDDAKYDVDQSIADYTSNAQWRAHDHLHIDVAAMRPSTSYRETFRNLPHPEHVKSTVRDERDYARPLLVSKFSFDSDLPPRRSFFRRR